MIRSGRSGLASNLFGRGHAARAALGLAVGLTATLAAACGEGDRSVERSAPAGSAAVAGAAPETATRLDPRPRVVVLGDSLTAGLGLDPAEAYPTLLQQKLDGAGLAYQVVNAGVSGDTSAGGLSRLDLALEGDVRVLVVALGGNDALRALPIAELRRNLTQVVERAQARRVRVVLAGMEAPPNLGADYVKAFRGVYTSLAKERRIALLPFLLDGVAGVDRLNQRDGIHPTAEGARVIADRLWPILEPVVRADAKGVTPQ